MTLSKSKTSSLAVSLSTSSANSASSHNGGGGGAPTLNTASNNSSTTTKTSNYQECADCSSPSAFWASLNHGVVVCDQCCLAHRSLGRAISIIKSLKKSYWPQSQIDTLYELVRNNSNSIWEANLNNSAELMKHSLLKNLKKPTPKDSYATKANYVKIKYENLGLVSRGKHTSIDELNQQLLASVRTSDLKSTLRILSQGADANYRNAEDGNQCVHAAVIAGELGQIELLCLYGADVASLDRNGLTPSELARMHHPNHPQIADRLVELQFELTDELSYFLANKRPDHRNARHFLIPDIENFSSMKDIMNRLKLDELPDHLFEELAKDIFDEMDRRQIESIWKCTVSQNLVNEPIPFLVIKSCFTQMRNQLRQKLARFNSHEFSCLLVEILNEAQRRYNQIENPISPKGAILLDDEDEEEDPLYDKVPSDEDYASVASESSSTIQIPIASSTTTTNTPSKKSTTTTISAAKKSPYQVVSPLNVLTSAAATAGKLTSSLSPKAAPSTLKAGCSPSATLSNSSSSKSSSNKNTPSPKSSSSLFPSHKILNTRFEKVPTASATAALAAASSAISTSGLPSGVLNTTPTNPSNSSALVANAESCLNSIINSLNQIDYSHLTGSNINSSNNHRNYCGGLTNNESSSATDFVQSSSIGDIRPNLYNELKSENELMQAMIERLMDENAQLRAEKMLLTANTNTTSSTASTINSDTNITHYAMFVENRPSSRSVTEELSLYSTVKNNSKKLTTSNKSDFQQQQQQQQHANIFDEHSNYKKFYEDSNNLEIIEEGLYQYDESNQEQESEKLKSNMISSKEKFFPTSKSASSTASSLGVAYYHSASNNGVETISQLPSKDSVIRAMKKITKTVQDLFKATKLSEFSTLRISCDKVNNSVHEMISLFPLNLNSAEIEENLITLEETCKNLTDLMGEYNSKIDLFVNMGGQNEGGESSAMVNDSSLSSSSKQQQISTSSSSSSAISSSNSDHFKHQQQQQLSAEDIAIKNMIITNLVSYSYEIAHTVKRIVCAMGAD